ncbi:hypothetical protein EPUL_004497 [Erysiphe pulchra]|uniref:Uncharacterized protein n=1 Tax=Erysiphe pulchra TaxID=225359 RepID=A0A2S4PLN7_9PEZI|nr:hypothetical protein EPUL_004497 [Erysiphe pulchra]
MTSQNMPNQWFDAKDESKVTREAYIEFRLKQYKSTTLRDDSLWEVFHEDFESWKDSTFSKADSYVLYELRDFLRKNGMEVDYIASPRVQATQKEIKPRYRKSRYKSLDDNGDIDDNSDAPMTKQISDLAKFYLNGQNKYGGEDLYDFLDQKGRAADYYCEEIIGNASSIKQMVEMIKLHFETNERTQAFLKVWRGTTLQKIITNNPNKNRLECLELLLNYFWKTKQGLPDIYRTDTTLKDALINAGRGTPECSFALYDPAQTFEGLSAKLRSSIGTAMDVKQSSLQESYQMMTQPEIYWTDRKYFGQGRSRGQGFGRKEPHVFRGNTNINSLGIGRGRRREGRQGCWSTKHPQEERQLAYSRFCTQYTHSSEPNLANFQGFLANYEGIHGIEDLVVKQDKDKDIDIDEAQYILDNMQIEDEFQEDDSETVTYFSDDLGKLNGIQILTHLQDHSVWHFITKSDPFEEVSIQQAHINDVFSFDGRYNGGVFQGIMPDTGAAGVSTVGKPQFRGILQDQHSFDCEPALVSAFGLFTGLILGLADRATTVFKRDVAIVTQNIFNNSISDSNSEPSNFEEEDYIKINNNVSRSSELLLPPPLVSYPTYESFRFAIRAWTKEQGYDLVVKQTKSFNSKISEEDLFPQDKLSDGIWLVADDRQNPEGSWSTKYKNSEQGSKHNHGPEFGIANHRRYDRDGESLNEIRGHIRTGVTTAQSMTMLRLKFPTLVQSKSDISNVKTRFRQETLKSMAALLLSLQKNSFFTMYTVDDDNNLHQTFIDHPKPIELFRKFNNILILDCTYKTNRYRKPLLNICGMTGLKILLIF